jgi:HEAT repeat protein
MSETGPADRARDLADLAREEPSSVDPDDLEALLDADSADARWYALQAIRTTSSAGELDLTAFVDELGDALTDDDSRVQTAAAMAVGDLADREPTAVTGLLSEMTALLSTDEQLLRTAVADYLIRIADAAGESGDATGESNGATASESGGDVSPAVLEPVVSDLRSLLEDPAQRDNAVLAFGSVADQFAHRLTDDADVFSDVFVETTDGPDGVDMDGPVAQSTQDRVQESTAKAKVNRRAIRNAAAESLVAIAREDSSALEESLPALADVLDDPNPDARSYVLEVFEAVASADADAVSPYLDAVAARLEDGTGVCEHAALALAAVSQSDPDAVVDAVAPYHDAVVDLLGHQAPAVRGAAVGILSYVAEESPDAVDPEPVRPLLHDDHAYVRGNAVWVLGYLGDETVREMVRERAESDPDPEVRSAAEAALERL